MMCLFGNCDVRNIEEEEEEEEEEEKKMKRMMVLCLFWVGVGSREGLRWCKKN
jgi:hypothetical protein